MRTDGATRTLKVGPTQISLKRTTPRNMAAAGRLSGSLIQALRNLGESHVTPERIERLRQSLTPEQRAELLKDLALAPGVDARPFPATGKALTTPLPALAPAFTSLSTEDRGLALADAALRTGLSTVILEKDFWVSWLLGLLSSLRRRRAAVPSSS